MKRSLSLTLVAVVSFVLGLAMAGLATAKRSEAGTRPATMPAKKVRPQAKPAKKVKPRYPYVSAKLNAPCGKTEFEWRCANAKVNAKPVKLTKRLNLVLLTFKPQSKGMLIRAGVVWRKGYPARGTDVKRTLSDVLDFDVPRYVKKKVGYNDPDYLNTELRLSVNGRPYGKKNTKGITLVKKRPARP